jgi:hypothetical protein
MRYLSGLFRIILPEQAQLEQIASAMTTSAEGTVRQAQIQKGQIHSILTVP